MQSSLAGQAMKARPISKSNFKSSTSRGFRLVVQAKVDLQGGPRIIRGKCFVTRDVSLQSILTDTEREQGSLHLPLVKTIIFLLAYQLTYPYSLYIRTEH